MEHQKENGGGGVGTNFGTWSRDTRETLLHLVLKKLHKKALVGAVEDLEKMDERYQACVDVLMNEAAQVGGEMPPAPAGSAGGGAMLSPPRNGQQ